MRPVRARGGGQAQSIFGGRVPRAVGLLLVATLALSLTVAFGERHAGSVYELVVLAPSKVLHGQVWRLGTWGFVETSPIGLIFQCLTLYWFGRDLVSVWGARRFLQVYLGLAVGVGVAASLAALIDPALREASFVGGWPLTTALTVAWGLTFPDRVIRIYFIIPIRGKIVAWLTVAITVVFAIYEGWENVAPELLAEAGMLGFVFRKKLTLHLKLARIKTELGVRGVSRRSTRSHGHLRVVEPAPRDRDKLN
jgi:membrane associated rhomboid family serine protease